jgi:hypothetical protein
MCLYVANGISNPYKSAIATQIVPVVVFDIVVNRLNEFLKLAMEKENNFISVREEKFIGQLLQVKNIPG